MIEKENKPKYTNEVVGYIDYAFNWRINATRGYIVQKITMIQSGIITTYWEAWYVNEKGKIFIEQGGGTALTPQDTWAWLSIKWGETGYLKITGDVYWVASGSDAAAAVMKWKVGGVTHAGGLKSSTKEPAGLGDPVLTETKEWYWNTRDKTTDQFLQVFNTKWETSYKNWEDWDEDREGNIEIIVKDMVENFSDIPVESLGAWVSAQVASKLD